MVDRDLYDQCMGKNMDSLGGSMKAEVALDETYDDTVTVLGENVDVVAVTIELTMTVGDRSDTGTIRGFAVLTARR